MKRLNLTAQKREVVGKKVRQLRKKALIPAAVYGRDIQSLSIQIPVQDFEKAFKEAGETGLIDLKVDSQVYPVLIKNVQAHPVSGKSVHAEFHKVNLKEKISANVPLELKGESSAVRDGIGLLLQTLSEVEVEALPTDLPEKIEVSVAHLAKIGDQITVGDMKVPDGVQILTSKDEVVIKVASAVSEEAKKEAEIAAAAAEAAKTEVSGEGATPIAGDAGAETKNEGPAKEGSE